MINHPLTEELKSILDIPYNFYIEGYSDLKALLKARLFKLVDEDFDNDFVSFSKFTKKQKDSLYTLLINNDLFDDDNKLKFIKKTDWNSAENIEYYIEEEEEEELPF